MQAYMTSDETRHTMAALQDAHASLKKEIDKQRLSVTHPFSQSLESISKAIQVLFHEIE